MKIVLFDTILERHLCESLHRAFTELGHEVIYTDLILHGHSMISDPKHIEVMEAAIEKFIDNSVDLVISFRPMNLNKALLTKIKKHAAIAIWLSDDPVLYKTCYGEVVDEYDIILHCGSERVLSFYKDKGHKAGVNFPFWTDNVALPNVYAPEYSTTDGIFLGNMHGAVRHKRYKEIAGLDCNIKIFGLLDSDFNGMHGGNIRDGYINIHKISEQLQLAKFGISIPQYFESYIGLDEYYFDGLETLGYFQFPSRVIQYAASGLPIVALGEDDMKEVFPEIEIKKKIDDLKPYINNLVNDFDFAMEASRAITARFKKDYSAKSRALFLLDIMKRPNVILNESPYSRATAFTKY
ncbi:hypothetical protein [Aeromonas hydrophila]|uniref:hypothetical protein n=1 Tax=Aeromonas hydrophila TaxID=644 RepID=UPI001933942B|nr:hypothetical protein [Aeromonas hydrophila]MBM0439323.1 hypothetical protein [Aeromonas hydrophila subsp. ranae]MBW3830013.1 hypothetical protein [Aeromonas hydrophila]